MQGDADEQADSGFETLSVPDSPAVMDYSVGDGAIGDGAVYVPVSPQLAEVPDGGQIGVQAGARPNRADLEEIVDDDIVETIAERLWGLTEMFPEKIRNATSILASATVRYELWRNAVNCSIHFYFIHILLIFLTVKLPAAKEVDRTSYYYKFC